MTMTDAPRAALRATPNALESALLQFDRAAEYKDPMQDATIDVTFQTMTYVVEMIGSFAGGLMKPK